MEERTIQQKGIFEIKYLTSEESATSACLTDYLQILKLTKDLQADKNIARDTRKNIKSLHNKLRDARTYIN